MATFFVGGEFPSYMPIRATATKVLSGIDAKIASAVETKDKAYLESLKIRAQKADPNKLFYFTIEQAKLVGFLG
jgi:hypothetical protein